MPNFPERVRRSNNAGFTLVETALAVVVIALLLGGVLQGRALVRGMQTKDVLAMARDLSAASQAFKDRYHYLPGDWVYKANEIPNVTGGGNGNGIIDVPAPSPGNPSPASESSRVPQHLFNANFIHGGAGPLQSRFGAVRVVGNRTAAGSQVAGGATPVPATILNLIEFDNLPCDIAFELDTKLDDGKLNTGNARATVPVCTDETIVGSYAIPL